MRTGTFLGRPCCHPFPKDSRHRLTDKQALAIAPTLRRLAIKARSAEMNNRCRAPGRIVEVLTAADKLP